MELAVWLIASILTLNALLLGVMFLRTSLDRRRSEKQVRELEELWDFNLVAARNRKRNAVAISMSVTLILTGVAVATPSGGRVVGSALGFVIPVIFGDETNPHRSSILANEPVTPRGADSDSDLYEASGDPTSSSGTDRLPSPSGSPSDRTTPTFVVAHARSSTTIRVRWGTVPQATGYGVERSTNETTGWATIARFDEDVTTYTDEGLIPTATYFYRVRVLLSNGTAALPSDVVSATTSVNAPGPTVVAIASRGRTSIELAWTDVAEETGYRIERSGDGETGWIMIGTTGQDITTYTGGGLLPGTTYFFRVFAINDGGSSASSNVVSGTTRNGLGGRGTTEGEGDGGGGEPSPSPSVVL